MLASDGYLPKSKGKLADIKFSHVSYV